MSGNASLVLWLNGRGEVSLLFPASEQVADVL
jgi:hypothetical protein